MDTRCIKNTDNGYHTGGSVYNEESSPVVSALDRHFDRFGVRVADEGLERRLHERNNPVDAIADAVYSKLREDKVVLGVEKDL